MQKKIYIPLLLTLYSFIFTAPENKCGDSTCKNYGICIPHSTMVTCDCEMTSFVGNQCDQRKFLD